MSERHDKTNRTKKKATTPRVIMNDHDLLSYLLQRGPTRRSTENLPLPSEYGHPQGPRRTWRGERYGHREKVWRTDRDHRESLPLLGLRVTFFSPKRGPDEQSLRGPPRVERTRRPKRITTFPRVSQSPTFLGWVRSNQQPTPRLLRSRTTESSRQPLLPSVRCGTMLQLEGQQ